MSRTGIPRHVVVVVAAVFIVVLTAPGASAHAQLTRSTPAEGVRLDALPATATLTFSETVRTPAFVAVTGPGQASVTSGSVRTRDANLIQPLGESAGPGQYTLSYRVTSADGHPVSGTLHFSLQGTSAAAVSKPAPTATAASTSKLGTGQLALLLAALAAGFIAVAAGTRRAVYRATEMVEGEPRARSQRR